MKLNGHPTTSVRVHKDGKGIAILDQTLLPFEVKWIPLSSWEDCADAIRQMKVRGAPLIGIVAAYGYALATRVAYNEAEVRRFRTELGEARPTAINLRWALDRLARVTRDQAGEEAFQLAWTEAKALAKEDIEVNESIGRHGLEIIKRLSAEKNGARVNILTHCNAGWFATMDYGTATAPIYMAAREGIKVHVFVDETRPRNQGAITAFELMQEGIPCTVITDNAGGLLMQQNMVDAVIVGTDRVTANGDVCNKIGTYLKALAAFDNNVPFYVALPTSTIDLNTERGSDVPIEERDIREVTHIRGYTIRGLEEVRVFEGDPHVVNPGFDITPGRLVTHLITERGLARSTAEGVRRVKLSEKY